MQDLTKILKVGDTVYSRTRGRGTVVKIESDQTYFPIKVIFGEENEWEENEWYTKNGMLESRDLYPDLCPTDPGPPDPFPEPKLNFEFDEVILVDEPDRTNVKRHFSHWLNGVYYCFRQGRSSKTTSMPPEVCFNPRKLDV